MAMNANSETPEQARERERRTAELAAWARAPARPAGESFPIHQMGPDGKRKARYKRKEQHDSGHFHTE